MKRACLLLILTLIPVYCWGSEVSLPPEDIRIWALGKKMIIEHQMIETFVDCHVKRERFMSEKKAAIEMLEQGASEKTDETGIEEAEKEYLQARDKLADIDREFDQLEQLVKAKHGGKLPDWWTRDTEAWNRRRELEAEKED